MKKLGLILLVTAFSLQLFSVPALADKLTKDEKDILKDLKTQIAKEKDKEQKKELKEEYKELKASFKS